MSYLLVSLALANHNLPSEWAREEAEDVATAIHILNQRAEELNHG